jgi:hypothetical protein
MDLTPTPISPRPYAASPRAWMDSDSSQEVTTLEDGAHERSCRPADG